MPSDNCEQTISIVEPGPEQYTVWAFDYRDVLPRVLAQAGASEHLINVVATYIPGVRHSPLMVLFRHHAHAEADPDRVPAPTVEGCEEAYRLGGGQFGKLWDGELADAFFHSDYNNHRIILAAYSPEQIIAQGLTSDRWGRDPDYLRKLVGERVEMARDYWGDDL